MPTSTAFSEGPLPAVHAAALELHLVAIGWLASVRQRNSKVSRIRRATERTALAVEAATAGHRRSYHLGRAHEAMVSSLGLFRLLYLEGHIDARVFDQARRRIDQILAGLDQLSAATKEEWLTLELVPLEKEVTDYQAHPEFSRLQSLLARVAEAVRSLLPGPSTHENARPRESPQADA